MQEHFEVIFFNIAR